MDSTAVVVDQEVEGAGGARLHVRARGLDGPGVPVLLVHGLASNARLWDGVAGHLAASGHPVAAVDQRGHGLSAKPDEGYDFATLCADLLAVAAAFGWQAGSDRRPVVAGQSWGANVAVELAARHPAAARALVLVDGGTIELSGRFADWPTCEAALAPPVLDHLHADRLRRLVAANHPDWPEEGIDATMANFDVRPDGTVAPRLPRALHMRILRGLWDQRPSQLFPDVAVPVAIVSAYEASVPDARWMAAKKDEVARAATLLRRSSTTWMEGDHDLHAQHPAEVARVVRETAGLPWP